MRRTLLSVVVLLSAFLVPFVAPSAAHANPSVEATKVLVTNQDGGGGCAYNQHVLIADPFGGGVTAGGDLGIAPGVSGVINEAKPLNRSNQIIALWGGGGGTAYGGVGIYDRSSSSWTAHFPLPQAWENLNNGNTAHSVDQLPDGNIVVATVGNLGSGTPEGNLVVFNQSGTVLSSLALPSAHGVVWDASRNMLFAVGYTTLIRAAYDPTQTPMLRVDHTWNLPTNIGHDLQRRRVDNSYYVTTDSGMYVFDPDASTFSEILKGDGTHYTGVKSLDARFDGLATYAYWKTNVFQFVNSTSVPASFCSGTFYKVRWLYDQGQPLYREDDVTPGYTQSNFVASTTLDKPANQQQSMGPSRWVGAHAWSNKTDVATAITGDINAGKVPYIFLYQWGDSGMASFQSLAQSQLDDWTAWASKLATTIGTHEAYVVIEPEWDTNIGNGCSTRYSAALGQVVAQFRRHAVNTHLVNGMGFWNLNPGTSYDCFKESAKLFDLQGVSLHLMSNYSQCAARTSAYPGPYPGGYSLSALTDPASPQYAVKIAETKATWVHKIFGTPDILIDDMAVTRCEPSNPSPSFGNAGQTQILQVVTGAFSTMYDQYGLRGYMLRTGGPADPNARAMGNDNELYFDYPANPDAVTQVNNAVTTMETHVTTVTNGSGGSPAFTATADVPSSVDPGGTATITTRVTDSGGALSNGTVTVDVLDPNGAVAGTHQFTGQTFANSEMKVLSWTWTAAQTTGTYSVRVTVTGSGGSPTYYNQSVATFAVAANGPTFSAAEVASPRTIPPGGTTSIGVTVTDTGGSLSSGDVTVTVYDPNNAVAGTTTESAQTFGAGETKSYTVPFTAGSSPPLGTYTARVGVAASGGSPTYSVDDAAGTFDVVSNQFTSTATVTHTSVSPGSSATISATFTNNGGAISNLITDIEVYDPNGQRVLQTSWSNQSFTAGGSLPFSTTWTPTTSSATGAYTVKLGVFTAGWATTLHWNGQAASTGVANAVWDTSATASPVSIAPSGTTAITALITNNGGSYDNANIDVEVYNSGGTRVGQLTWSGQTVGNGETKSYTYNWTAPATAGTYTVKIGVMAPSWTPTLSWNNNAEAITVTAPTFTASSTVSASSVAINQSVDITATFQATGGAVVNGKTDIEVYNSVGTRVAQGFWTDSLADGASVTHTYTWAGTATPGTYTVKLGVFSGDWSSTYYWNNNARTITVGGTTFQPTFTVGSGANAWWIEVYTSNDVTSVDAIGRDGQFYLALTKRSWGAWAATAPSALANGDMVQFVAHRSSDSSSAASSDFGWLTQSPTTSPGWSCTFSVGAGSSTTWVEVYVSTGATSVDVKIGSGAWTALTLQTYGAWAKAINVSAGTKVLFRATRSDSAKAYSSVYNWLQ